MRYVIIIFSLAAMVVICPFMKSHADEMSVAGSEQYWPSSTCRDCHVKIFDQHMQSIHARSFVDPVFQAQYFKEVLPRTKTDAGIRIDAEGCIACHSPVTYSTGNKLVKSTDDVSPESSGVTCDFCHTLKNYKGDKPGNGDYISVPSKQKLGPFQAKTNWHHVYSLLHTKSEFCAICHNQTNRFGLEIKSTYTEWMGSPYAKIGIQCQDCHMTVKGFLVEDEPEYESGKASYSLLGFSPYRAKLYTHRFPGAHIKEQVEGSIRLGLELSSPKVVPGENIAIKIMIDNTRTGHKMPTGSADLRFMYLDVRVTNKTRVFAVPAEPVSGVTGYDITGFRVSDNETLGDKIPKGMRIYRAIFIDAADQPTLSSFEAVKIIFDNRIEACEIRQENYEFTVPEDAEDYISVDTRLYYMPYPSIFAARMGLPEAEPVEISSITKKFDIK